MKLNTEKSVEGVEYTLTVTRRFKEIFERLNGEGSAEGLAISLVDMEGYIENYDFSKSEEGQREIKEFKEYLDRREEESK